MGNPNKKDSYGIVEEESGKIIQKFRTKNGALHLLSYYQNNPKYIDKKLKIVRLKY